MSVSENTKPFGLLLAFTLVSTTLSGCDQLFNYAVACIDDDQPELSPGALPNPILNQVYNESISVAIRNEPYDDSYDYTFKLSGEFPTGMQASATGRNFRLFGTPTEMGIFNFEVSVTVEPGSGISNNTEGLCSIFDRKFYQWTIQPM